MLDILVLHPDVGLGGADAGALGHGTSRPMSAEAAHEVARNSSPSPGHGVDPADALGLATGDRVAVAADDYGRDPVEGDLLTLSLHEVVLSRSDPAAGTVHVHFPRIGYRVVRI